MFYSEMGKRRDNIEIVLPRPSKEDMERIPVWDAFIDKVIIDESIPSLISDMIVTGVSGQWPQKFSGQLKGTLENTLNHIEKTIYNRYHITYSKLRVIREGYSLFITTQPDQYFDIWES